jgi:succinate dehydrogenase/fumarate reductase flavoprotein subunit
MTHGSYSVDRLATDLLIIGSEGAGCMAAIAAEESKLQVLMVTKGQWGKSGATVTGAADFAVDSKSLNTEFGFKGASREDSMDLFMEDTVNGGKNLANQKLVRILVEEAPSRLRLLIDWGAHFGGRLIKASGHTYPRGVFFPGPSFVQVLKRRTRAVDNLKIMVNTMVLDLVVERDRVLGALALNQESGQFLFIEAKAVILASGGAMGVYKHSTAPVELTGDGFAIAARAGASLVDMEFPMFFPGLFAFPPALKKIEVPYHLSAAGLVYGHMYNKFGERFMTRWDREHLEHSTRDIVSVAMYDEILKGNHSRHGGVYVSLKHLPDDLVEDIIEWDPAGSLKKYGFGKAYFDIKHYLPDLARRSLEAVPACHFSNGGVAIDEDCCCPEVSGLFAAGEVTGGIHGGNRLSGTAFTDFFVFGRLAGLRAAQFAMDTEKVEAPQSLLDQAVKPYMTMLNRKEGLSPFQAKRELQELAWDKLGIIRSLQRVEEAVTEVREYKQKLAAELAVSNKSLVMNQQLQAAIEARNVAENLEMIGLGAKTRQESRAAHYLSESPMTDYTNWTKNIRLLDEKGAYTVRVTPVVGGWITPPEGIVPYGETEA